MRAFAIDKSAGRGELRVPNQFVETFSVNKIADWSESRAMRLGINGEIKSLPVPRSEMEDHYYNPAHTGLLELGLKPHYLTG